jgi:hypothetical protein
MTGVEGLGREDGKYLFEVFERLIFEGGCAPIAAKFEVFDTWCKLQILECEFRMANAGVTEDQMKIWKDACVDEMKHRCDELRVQMSRLQ